jgi:hypothetical protein
MNAILFHHLIRQTSTVGYRPYSKHSTTIGPALPHPAASHNLHQIVGPPSGGAYQHCVSRYAIAIRRPFRLNGRQSSSQCALPTAT